MSIDDDTSPYYITTAISYPNGKPHIGIGENKIVRRAIIDKDVRIGKNARLINAERIENKDAEDGSYVIREGIIIIPKGGVIPDNTVI